MFSFGSFMRQDSNRVCTVAPTALCRIARFAHSLAPPRFISLGLLKALRSGCEWYCHYRECFGRCRLRTYSSMRRSYAR